MFDCCIAVADVVIRPGAGIPPIPGTGALSSGMEVEFVEDALFIDDSDWGAIVLPMAGGCAGFGEMTPIREVLFALAVDSGVGADACMAAPGRADGVLEPEFVARNMLLDRKFSICLSCASENESNFSSIRSNAGSTGSRCALSVCFSFPNGRMIV